MPRPWPSQGRAPMCASTTSGDRSAATEVVETIEKLGRRSIAVQGDVGDESAVEALFAESDAFFGRLDILINNAGTGRLTPLEAVTTDFWNDIFRVDLTGPFLCTRAAAHRMSPRNYGRIVNVSSIGAVVGIDMDPAYTAAKAGLLGFTKSTARYLGRHNITVNSVCPGPPTQTSTGRCRKRCAQAWQRPRRWAGWERRKMWRTQSCLRLRLFAPRHGPDDIGRRRHRHAIENSRTDPYRQIDEQE